MLIWLLIIDLTYVMLSWTVSAGRIWYTTLWVNAVHSSLEKERRQKKGGGNAPACGFLSAFVDSWKREKQLFPTGNVFPMTVSKQLKLSRLWHLPGPATPPLLYLAHVQTQAGLRPVLSLPLLKLIMELRKNYMWVLSGPDFKPTGKSINGTVKGIHVYTLFTLLVKQLTWMEKKHENPQIPWDLYLKY